MAKDLNSPLPMDLPEDVSTVIRRNLFQDEQDDLLTAEAELKIRPGLGLYAKAYFAGVILCPPDVYKAAVTDIAHIFGCTREDVLDALKRMPPLEET